jgi:hypothetical protein
VSFFHNSNQISVYKRIHSGELFTTLSERQVFRLKSLHAAAQVRLDHHRPAKLKVGVASFLIPLVINAASFDTME